MTACTACFVTGIIYLVIKVYQRPLRITVDGSGKNNTPALNIQYVFLSAFLCVSPNIMTKANGFSNLFWDFFSFCLLCHSTPKPSHPSVHFGTSAGVGCVGWLALWWQLDRELSMSCQKGETECTPNVVKGQHWPMAVPQLPTKGPIFWCVKTFLYWICF